MEREKWTFEAEGPEKVDIRPPLRWKGTKEEGTPDVYAYMEYEISTEGDPAARFGKDFSSR